MPRASLVAEISCTAHYRPVRPPNFSQSAARKPNASFPPLIMGVKFDQGACGGHSGGDSCPPTTLEVVTNMPKCGKMCEAIATHHVTRSPTRHTTGPTKERHAAA